MFIPRFVCTPLCVIAAGLTASTASASPPQYRLDVLRPIEPPPPSYYAGWGVLDFGPAGTAVGSAPSGFDVRAVKWTGSTPDVLPILPGWTSSVAAGLNAHGLIVGSVHTLPTYTASRAVAWRNGVITELSAPPGSLAGALAVNDAGLIIGTADTPDGQEHALTWSDIGSAYTQLPPLPGHDSAAATDVNQTGLISGLSFRLDQSSLTQRPVVWRNGIPQELPVPPATGSAGAVRINDSGDASAGGSGSRSCPCSTP